MEKPLIKIIKKAKRECPQPQSEPGLVEDASRWSRAVRSWVVEFQRNARRESVPAFDRLFQPNEQRLS
jgi:hypothetical protein